ncbi:hypothetical protein J0A68_15955 [Algoriphagus sp. H41]|uniref:Uncharacterized protein n=1 Tax=Algoriphagus oliviformis TaxID=2811231 RepID=A0ABS3C610_9BACT|nr:hypothetical protein [Algoriphagus oliviformis]MBN7812448.1 hypothetical protein [Algoriphagus oliviformis]
MTKPQIPDLKAFYRLPFEEGSFELTEKTLNLNSTFQKPDYPFPVAVRNVLFRNEILTLGVKIDDEPEQLVFLKVSQHALLVSCDSGTYPSFLSRHAYLGLYSLIGYSTGKCFKKYFWPDFFDPQTGRSKFLTVYNDRQGLDIEVKSKYPHFYRPGDALIEWLHEPKNSVQNLRADTLEHVTMDESSSSGMALGYFLADINLSSIHSNHYPFLVPFLGIPTKDRERIKSFVSTLASEMDLQGTACTPVQQRLNAICFKMRELAPVDSVCWWKPFSPDATKRGKGSQLLELWHEAKRLILSQKFVFYYNTHGLKYLSEKPTRRWATPCFIRKERPQLVLKRLDKGDYYQFELRFRAHKKVLLPEKRNIAFFVNSRTDPANLYLLDQFTDFQLVLFFSRYGYKLAILKCHYKDEIKAFMDYVTERYELMAH